MTTYEGLPQVQGAVKTLSLTGAQVRQGSEVERSGQGTSGALYSPFSYSLDTEEGGRVEA